MKFDIWGQTDVGLKRESNEDSILINRDLALFIVADGMGGHQGGEIASDIAVHTTQEIINSYNVIGKDIPPADLLRKCFIEASARIYHKGSMESPELLGMGTTMVMGFIKKKQLFIGNVGDSRAYMFKSEKLWQLTEDHSLVNEQIKAGIIKESDLPYVSGKNVITRSVGFERSVDPDIFSRKVEPGEIYLFCSDGLCGLVEDKKIAKILKNTPTNRVVEKSIEAAKSGGGDDNISVLVLEIS